MKASKVLILLSLFIVPILVIAADTQNLSPHTIYGRVLDGTGEADGATVTAELDGASVADTVTTGNYPEDGMWKVNIYNLGVVYEDGDIITVKADDGSGNTAEGTLVLDLSVGNQMMADLVLASENNYPLEITDISIDGQIAVTTINHKTYPIKSFHTLQLSIEGMPVDIMTQEVVFMPGETVIYFDHSEYTELTALHWSSAPGSVPQYILSMPATQNLV